MSWNVKCHEMLIISIMSTFIRASGGGRLWRRQLLIKRGVVPSPSLRLLLHPWSASRKVWPQPLPPVWGEAGRLWGKRWFWQPWFLHLLGCRQHQLDSLPHDEVPPNLVNWPTNSIIYFSISVSFTFHKPDNSEIKFSNLFLPIMPHTHH